MKPGQDERQKLVQEGIDAGETDMYREDRIWSQFSSDKVDISEVLMEVVRGLHRTLPPEELIRALSVGSGSEPQFQILESAFRGGLYLLDSDDVPLARVRKDIRNRCIEGVRTLKGDYTRLLATRDSCRAFLKEQLGGGRVHLITLHHSLYYSDVSSWQDLFESMMGELLEEGGALHAVLMSPACHDRNSTAWLYQHFAGEFFGCGNDQDLAAFGRDLAGSPAIAGVSVRVMTHRVRFFVKDFRKLMSVVWMILLYPEEHRYDQDQRREITEYVYDNFWLTGEPLVQLQDHLVITG
ncbi:MAG: hypothetical protein JXA64_03515 [Candidatus Fermentibacteraceae bacterium]|nr:hypothetical protein [Candidatus Fermentibacteraceae bacterium]MBN2608161.1 hypothetical protein [Candidatus Fermentibacteraceae bacterium]